VALAGVMGSEVTLGAWVLQRRWPEVAVPLLRRQWRRQASRRATGEGAVHATSLEGLIYPSASLLRGEGRETLRGTARRGKTAVGPAVRRGARPAGPARRATWRVARGG
jgi:hypothetical protein